MPSVPSLKNLVTEAVTGGQLKTSRSQRSTSSEKPAMQRNFSTKSFVKSNKYDDLDEDDQPPIRKCETVIALSRMSGSSSSSSSSKQNKTLKKSTLSVFKSLTKSATTATKPQQQPQPQKKANVTQTTTAAASTVGGSTCEDTTFPVRAKLTIAFEVLFTVSWLLLVSFDKSSHCIFRIQNNTSSQRSPG